MENTQIFEMACRFPLLSAQPRKRTGNLWSPELSPISSKIPKLLTNELNVKVVPLQQFDGIHVAKSINLAEAKLAEYFNLSLIHIWNKGMGWSKEAVGYVW